MESSVSAGNPSLEVFMYCFRCARGQSKGDEKRNRIGNGDRS